MPTNKIIVALDTDEADRALRLARQIKEYVTCFKVGSQLFTREGPDIVHRLRDLGVDVFLDLKFHDIPETVRKAVRAAAALGPKFLTVHASGGTAMLEAALEGAEGHGTTILGVTVLTSIDEPALRATGVPSTPARHVVHLARLAHEAGVRGIVCSPLEIESLRAELGPKTLLVTPGIRGAADPAKDQKRTLSAAEALRRGASYLVVGRPITEADDPEGAAIALYSEVASIEA